MIDRNLELFVRAAEYGSITKAVKASYITQPAVSNAILKLENELGVKLFLRDKRNGLLLTDVGKQILILARQMEEIDNRIYQCACREKNMMGGKLRIAVLTSLVTTILSKALKEYRSLYPGIDIEIKEGTPNDIFEMIEEHAADFAVSCSPFGRFHAVSLIRDRIMAVFPPDSREKKAVSLGDPPDMLIINKPAYETILGHITRKDSVRLDSVLIVQNAETAIRMTADGIGVGIVSEYTLDTLAPDCPKYPVDPQITFDIGLFANDLKDLTPAAAEFIRLIRENPAFHGREKAAQPWPELQEEDVCRSYCRD